MEVAAPEHVELSGPNKLKVIVPVGLKPPPRVAVSSIEAPTATAGDAWLVSVVVAALTTTLSLAELHELIAELLAPSPL